MAQGIEVTDPEAYRRKLDGLLAGSDPLEVFGETPARLRRLFAERSAEAARAQPFEGKWTPLEVLGHLVDVEWCLGWRVRIILGADRPTITPMDQDDWVAAQRINEQDLAELLDDFEALRRINLRLWRRLTPQELQRVGVHSDRGEESLELILTTYAGHDLSHLDQIERYFAAIG